MNAKLIATALVAFVVGHDIAVTRLNRRAANLQSNLNNEEKAGIMLRWFHAGHDIALADKDRVAEAYAKHFPSAPAHTVN